MARKKIADPTRDLSQYYEQPIGRKAPQASMQLVTSDGGAVPIKKVNPKVQMTPIVQPVAFVPYSTQKEPLYTSTGERAEVETDYDVDDEEAIAERYAYGEPAAPAENAKKEVRGQWRGNSVNHFKFDFRRGTYFGQVCRFNSRLYRYHYGRRQRLRIGGSSYCKR